MKYSAEQLRIINAKEDVILVHAVAGAGKTTTIKGIIKKAIAKGVKTDKIMACTFTRKMAKELKDGNKRLDWVDTIHGICFRIVDAHKESLGYKRITLIDEHEDNETIKSIISRNNFKISQTGARTIIDHYSNTGEMPKDKKANEIFLKAYLRELRESDLITYGLIELYGYIVLQSNHDIGFDLVIVDEYQDTTTLEANIVRLLAKKRLIVVGDMMQSIYGFRGSNLHNIECLPNATEHNMSHSYRLPESIASFANHLILGNNFGYSMSIEPNGKKGKVELINDITSESVRDSVERLLESYEPQQIYILTRTNRQISSLMDILDGLPIDKDLSAIRNMKYLSYLDIACGAYYNNFYDRGMIRLLRLFDYRDAQLIALERDKKKIFENVKNDIPVKEFVAIMRRDIPFRNKAEVLLPMFEKQRGEYDHFMSRVLPYLDNIESDIDYIQWYQDMSVADFMPQEKIAIITAHTSKGMENDVIVIPSITDGTFPNSRASTQEELRLFYVACTRAREHLVVHYKNSMFIRDM